MHLPPALSRALVGAAVIACAACSAEPAPSAGSDTLARAGAAGENSADPSTDPSAGASAGAKPKPVSESRYDATAKVACTLDGTAVEGGCEAGVIREWSGAGGALVEVFRPDGTKRSLYYDGTVPIGANRSDLDGTTAWMFTTTPQAGIARIDFGPEHYEVPDALIGADARAASAGPGR